MATLVYEEQIAMSLLVNFQSNSPPMFLKLKLRWVIRSMFIGSGWLTCFGFNFFSSKPGA